MKKICFVSSHNSKFEEIKTIFKDLKLDIELEQYKHGIDEIQNQDMKKIVEDKLIKAFQKIGHPVIVEHTGLFLNDLNGYPGGLTRTFWDSLGAEKISDLFSKNTNKNSGKLIAKSMIGYCDGKKIELFEGEIEGSVVNPRGENGFNWDCIFQVSHLNKTFAEMTSQDKNKVSMRRKAVEKLVVYLNEVNNSGK